MNYLGHAFLSFGDAEVLTGNMIGDFVKGKAALDKFPDGIKKGILLHRTIDAFSDNHPALQRARIWFRPDFGLYAAAIIDSLCDHFLANDPKYFSSEEKLFSFSQDTYQLLQTQANFFPENFISFFEHMRTHNWLYHYRTMHGIKRSLIGLQRRAQHMPDAELAYKIFAENYYAIAQCYSAFIDEVVEYVNVELTS